MGRLESQTFQISKMSLEGNFVDFLRICPRTVFSERFRMYPDGAVLLRVANSIHQARVKLVHKKSGHYRPPGDASPEPFQKLRSPDATLAPRLSWPVWEKIDRIGSCPEVSRLLRFLKGRLFLWEMITPDCPEN